MGLDWTPLTAQPGADLPDTDLPDDRALRHAAGLGHQHNGMPDVLPYTWRPGEAQREAALEARLAAIRRVAEQRALARAAVMAHGPTCTCRLCIEQYGPIPDPPPPGTAP